MRSEVVVAVRDDEESSADAVRPVVGTYYGILCAGVCSLTVLIQRRRRLRHRLRRPPRRPPRGQAWPTATCPSLRALPLPLLRSPRRLQTSPRAPNRPRRTPRNDSVGIFSSMDRVSFRTRAVSTTILRAMSRYMLRPILLPLRPLFLLKR
ncbi:hypothetical protein K466DRAFT_95568 [Polyporus arcularius HHB13444]|uniref:Uncharacterized protein n=1 Tax=Polyporus arcularius HHB13444 TaxID=1314778 RepID=A0A5C3PF69_9APHY|nr:hypothetical protein K466DRAFT_95568 [Polyporus arcularius HHB13444]